ncbi:MAG TPA: YbaK/EbsC family protein [Myxococcales bacterium]|nr:YbaK/EbsC family protein [Myxococcales bacterium]
MIPQDITDYLHTHRVDWQQRQHRLAVTAEELAATLHVTARRVAKSVLVQVDAQVFIAVLPATEVIDEDRLASVLGATIVRVMREWEFEELFPECEPGAEPPFGGLYGLPVVVDSALADEERIIVRAGSHVEAIEMRYEDFYRLEKEPRVAAIGRARSYGTPTWSDWRQTPAAS